MTSSSKVPKTIDPKRKTVGIRIPDHSIPLELIARLGHPIITTSVHDEDKIVGYPTDPELIYEKYIDHVDIVIDGGIGGNLPSTVYDLTGRYSGAGARGERRRIIVSVGLERYPAY